MAFLAYNAGPAPQQLTGLAIARAHTFLQIESEEDESIDIRRIYFPFKNISTVYEAVIDIGQGRSYTELRWTEPIDDLHCPGLASLLRWLRFPPSGAVGPRGLRGIAAPQDTPLMLRGRAGRRGPRGMAAPAPDGAMQPTRRGARGEAGRRGARGAVTLAEDPPDRKSVV